MKKTAPACSLLLIYALEVPDLYIISGPNGAGKTTTALKTFPDLGVTTFVNADIIAQGISPLDVDSAARAAGRLMLQEMENHLKNGRTFALETTLASRTLSSFIARCQQADFTFILIYVWLENADLAVKRVAKRVQSGGHNIPEEIIRRRYERGLKNFFDLYSPLADSWTVLDNSDEETVFVAQGGRQLSTDVMIAETWQQMQARGETQ